jgi:sarcosine oxidase
MRSVGEREETSYSVDRFVPKRHWIRLRSKRSTLAVYLSALGYAGRFREPIGRCMQSFDVIVVGTGGIGSAAAYHLAARGRRVLGLDRFPIAHDRGSSHGQTRLIRQAYFEHPDYVPLLLRAYELWRELEERVGRRLLVESGLVMAGPPEGSVIVGALMSAQRHQLTVDRMTACEARGRWPVFALPEEWHVVHEPHGGYLFVEACVRAHAEAARQAGATLEHGVAVHGWRNEGSGIAVETNKGTYRADRLVLAPGPWAAGLLQLPAVPLTVLRKSLFWYAASPAAQAAFSAGALPCFAFDAPTGFFYGFPQIDGRGVKVAEHTGGHPVADPLAVDREIDSDEKQRVEQILAAHLPALGCRCTEHAVCLYTMSPDHHFLTGLHPANERVAIAAGFSGHGFKFASVMGEALADLATAGETALPIRFLSPRR